MSSSTASPAWDAPPPSPSPAAVQPPAPALAPPEQYTVITRGVSFHLSCSQIEYDSPNYFTWAFLEHDFAEAASKVIYLDRNPQLFALIVEHLSGYEILPLASRAIPDIMTPLVALDNLRIDAEYFGLSKLSARLTEALDSNSEKTNVEGDKCIKDWLQTRHFNPTSAQKGAQELAEAGFSRLWTLRMAYLQGALTEELLKDSVKIPRGWSSIILASQTRAMWEAWEATREK